MGDGELLGGLHIIRCHGARIVPVNGPRKHIIAGDCPKDLYGTVAAAALLPNVAAPERR